MEVPEAPETGRSLRYRDGRTVTFVAEGTDEHGPYLVIEHRVPRPALLAGPHWHPVLTEAFTVRAGRARFVCDGAEHVLTAGDRIEIPPRQVHMFRSEGADLVLDHVVRPPLRHREMFDLWHRLDAAGRTTATGVPRNPLALALMWERQDGYVAGVPAWTQRALFGALAAVARVTGYEARWAGPRRPG
ncbi:mannose-6-phosphate isomerase-like protein (cupin superfamily) [Murinocardiopsis flavida]|uniref:Mannose-6-phosphate isomerase-like protein (Cupin superfamily) n=1 Tax=Murinocardiopsis flavida TaxID=645275 RepID=A0A2P8DDV1_9ACTN|nr:cupin domain-containing protein [Murinocardiopsis flavida]PSK95382.1 mannose-6-phosphate isomerase-like protein (cupin superfamily) [Murinocardiopsis flavida]